MHVIKVEIFSSIFQGLF